MTNTTTTLRHDVVDSTLADLESLSAYVHDLVNIQDPAGSESKKFGSVTVSVNDTFATTAAAAKASKSELVVSVDKEKWTNVEIDAREEKQDLGGAYMAQLAEVAFRTVKTEIDKDLLDHLAFGTGVSSGSTTTHNVSGATVATSHWRNALGRSLSQLGAQKSDLLFVMDPWAAQAVANLGTFSVYEGDGSNQQQLGVERLGRLDGVDVVESQGLPGSDNNRYSVAISLSATGSNGTTFTVPANHGFLGGMPISTTGLPANLASGSAHVRDVTATTVIVIGATSSMQASGQAGSLFLEAVVNLLIDRRYVYFLPESMLDFDFVRLGDKRAEALQVEALYGRGARNGFVQRILSPNNRI